MFAPRRASELKRRRRSRVGFLFGDVEESAKGTDLGRWFLQRVFLCFLGVKRTVRGTTTWGMLA